MNVCIKEGEEKIERSKNLAESGKCDLSDEKVWHVWKNYQEIFAIFSVFFIEMDIVWHRLSDKKLLELQMKFLCVCLPFLYIWYLFIYCWFSWHSNLKINEMIISPLTGVSVSQLLGVFSIFLFWYFQQRELPHWPSCHSMQEIVNC